MKYVKVIDGTKSNASGFEYKLNEVNISNNWNPNAKNGKEMGGFNYTTEDNVLRWLHRGNTIYDVTIPEDAEIVEVESKNCPHGVFRTNKIIISNPKQITEEIIIDLYKKSSLPENTYYQCLVTLLFKGHKDAVKYIIKDRININNIEFAIKEFENYISDNKIFNYYDLWEDAKEIYDILKEILKERYK